MEKDIVDELLDLGGSMQQCKVHQKAAAEIERLRKQNKMINAMFRLNMMRYSPNFYHAEFDSAIAKATGDEQ